MIPTFFVLFAEILNALNGILVLQVLIFAHRKSDVDDIHEYLLLKGVEAVAIHGDMGINYLYFFANAKDDCSKLWLNIIFEYNDGFFKLSKVEIKPISLIYLYTWKIHSCIYELIP